MSSKRPSGLSEAIKTLHRAEESGQSREVYDSASGLLVSRGPDGRLMVTLEVGDRWASESLENLSGVHCPGLRGKELEDAIVDYLLGEIKSRPEEDPDEVARATAGDRLVKEMKEDW